MWSSPVCIAHKAFISHNRRVLTNLITKRFGTHCLIFLLLEKTFHKWITGTFKHLLVVFLLIIFNSVSVIAASSEIVELPEEELSKESVTPIFDRMDSVRSRRIVTANRWDVTGFYGTALTEPISNLSKLGLSLYYHSSEDHAFGVLYTKNFTGLSDYAKQLNKQYRLDFSRAPAPEYTLMADYNLKMFYGKMSLSKKLVINLHLFATAAGGIVKYVHKSFPAVALGIGQKFYLTKQTSLRFDLRLYGHQAPVPFLAGSPGVLETSAEPNHSDFKEKFSLSTNLDVGLSYLF